MSSSRDAQTSDPAVAPEGFRFGRPATSFTVSISERDGTATLELAGEFDLSCWDRFEFHLQFVLSGDPDHVVIDLRALSFIDSSGMQLLLRAHQRSREAGFRLSIVVGEGQVKQALDIS